MMLHPAVTIHGLEEARRALTPGRPAVLLSAPGAGAWAGALWWRRLIDLLHVEFPEISFSDLLDCGDAPGAALAALRTGCRALVLSRAVPAWPAVAALARTLGAELQSVRPESLDLAMPGAEGRLDSWLRDTHGQLE